MNTPIDVPLWRKVWYRSKTALFGLATTAAGLANEIKPYTEDLRAALGSHWFGFVAIGLGLATLYLRHKTAGGLALTKAGES